MEWLLIVAVAIVLAFALVLWRTFDPSRKEELDEESRIPLHEDD